MDFEPLYHSFHIYFKRVANHHHSIVYLPTANQVNQKSACGKALASRLTKQSVISVNPSPVQFVVNQDEL
jgi:hypothetical protein